MQEVLWEDPDQQNVRDKPDEYYSGLAWDGIDQTLFIPLSRFFLADVAGPAWNVNAFDEVPNSSWFQNRIGVREMSLEEVREGACPENIIEDGETLTVTAAKPNGANPGFIIDDEDGRGWLVKFDGRNFSDERATTADVLGSRIYYAAGYHAPCNIVIYFDEEDLQIADDATSEDEFGNEVPITDEEIEAITDVAITNEEGQLRASASLFVDGTPIGPWTYQGVKKDDPNDVIPHEERRDLRGARLLAAWINHFDTREQNSLATFVEDEAGNQWVKHWYIDFGDSLGSRWQWDGLSRRFGHSYYFDVGDILVDFLSLGLVSRAWLDVETNDVAPLWAYFDAEHFDAVEWKPGYPNPAFNREQPGDGAWMARIIARFSEAHIRAMVSEARLSSETNEEELMRILLARQQEILDDYLRVVSPLADFEVRDGRYLCMRDLASLNRVFDPRSVRYHTRFYHAEYESPLWSRVENPASQANPAEICIDLIHENFERPSVGSDDGYAIVDIEIVPEPGSEPIPPARLHFYDTEERGFVLVGIERPERSGHPAE
jgi:hypothetical protein